MNKSNNSIHNDEQAKDKTLDETTQAYQNEEEEEKEEDEDEDQLSELTNFKKLNLRRAPTNRIPIVGESSPSLQESSADQNCKIHSINLNDQAKLEINDSNNRIKIMQELNERRNKNLIKNFNPRPLKVESSKKSNNDSNDDDDDEEDKIMAPRIERFLSIVEIPPEILLYTQQLAHQQREAKAAQEDKMAKKKQKNDQQNKVGVGKKVQQNAKKKDDSHPTNDDLINETRKGSNKCVMFDRNSIRHYHNGSGLTQAAKREIIKSIIKNFDMNKYLQEFKESQIVEVKLDRK